MRRFTLVLLCGLLLLLTACGETIDVTEYGEELAFDMGEYPVWTKDGEPALFREVLETGKDTLVVLWQPHCGPCDIQMDRLEMMLSEFTQEDIALLGYGIGDSEDLTEAFAGWDRAFPTIDGTDAYIEYLMEDMTSTPTLFLVDDEGHVGGLVLKGYLDEDDDVAKAVIRTWIEEVADE